MSMIIALAVTSRWRQSLGLVPSFGLYGALHASLVIVTLRTSRTPRTSRTVGRRFLFVLISAGLAMLSGLAGFSRSGSAVMSLTVSAGLGAASYALLIRVFWMQNLPYRGCFSIAVCCVFATLSALPVGLYLHTVGAAWFAAIWWCAFSTVLRYYDT